MAYHVPVLLAESIEGLNIKPNGTYVDLTFGGGGHSRLIMEKLNRQGRLFAFDQDEDALANAIDNKRFMLIRSNFKYFRNFLRYHGVDKVEGILAAARLGYINTLVTDSVTAKIFYDKFRNGGSDRL